MDFFYEHHKETKVIKINKIYFEPHLHYEIEIIYLLNGKTSIVLNGNEYEFSKGDFAIVFPNMIHSYKEGENIIAGKFIFSPDIVPELKEIFNTGIFENPVIKDAEFESKLASEILNSFDGSSQAVQKGYLLLLASKLIEHLQITQRKSGDLSALNRVFDYCQKNFCSNITQKDVAKALHLSDSYLSHLFSGKVGINFCAYINTLKINEACSLLSNSDKSITEVSEECGFGSLRSFNRVFLDYKKITPSKYRKERRLGL